MSKILKRGIDVSRHQGIIDWKKVKNSGVDFVIIKAGGSNAGIYTDVKFEENYKGAKEVGLPVGVYYYVGPKCTSTTSGLQDAKRFLSLLKGKKLEYPAYIDLEETPCEDRDGTTDAIIAFCEYMEKNGYYTGIYASDISGFKDKMVLSRLSKYDKWVARYGSDPKYVKEYGMHQHTSKGKVDGIAGNVDLNNCYYDYERLIVANGLNGNNACDIPASKPKPTVNKIKKWQEAAIKDGFSFPNSGADGIWGPECEAVATKAIIKTYSSDPKYRYKNLTKIVQNEVCVTEDGLCGANTMQGISEYQQKNGLSVDGTVGIDTWKKILNIISKPKPTVNKIKKWQEAAIKDGFSFPNSGADGIWGPECEAVATKAIIVTYVNPPKYRHKNLTKIVQNIVGVKEDGLCGSDTMYAIQKYQRKNYLHPDGAVGIDTWKKMLNI